MPTRCPKKCPMAVGFVLALASAFEVGASTVTIVPVADTFLTEFSPTNNTGAHTNLAAGTVSNGTRTRALLRFDIAAQVPPGARIDAASLQIEVTRVNAGGGIDSTFELRRVLVPWAEGDGTGNLGQGAAADQTTWSHRAYPSVAWANPGGAIGPDFSSVVSSSVQIAGAGGYTLPTSAALVEDVQSALDQPGANYGWVLLSEQESASETARRFASREDPDHPPTLRIEYAEPAPSFRITEIRLNGNEALLTWTNGRPTYQVQTRAGLTEEWVNVGPPTSATSAVVPVSGQQAFLRVVQDYTARYQVVFDATWSAVTHPDEFPEGSAHWSGLVGGVHNSDVHFWRQGETASEGIRMMAEFGSQPRLLSEISAAITNGPAQFTLSGGGINTSPGSRLLEFPQPMRRDFPLVTLCSMIAPSPDWFVGVDSLSLVENGQWVSNKVVTLYGHDAGTDSGATYRASDVVTVPRGVVRRFMEFPALVDGSIVPFGTFTFTRLD